ncbi:MAG TPA: hypothetical protein VH560_10945 [Polyangia bacterium]|nr:hypothetical protein [Polyangia bacterium]
MTPAPQSPPPGASPPPPPGYPVNQGWGAPPSGVGPNGEFVAPLSQTTQPYYVPQSVALSGPRYIKDWNDGEQIPWGYHREERVRKGEIISGAILFGVPYIISSWTASLGADLSSTTGESNPAGWLYLPVLGPFIEISKSDSAAANEFLVIDGLCQGIGAALFFHGLLSPRPILVRNDLALNVMVTPAPVGKDGTGMMFSGTF